MSILNIDEVKQIYRKRAKNYDLTANLYYMIGYREYAYRQKVVDALGLKRGDTVVELGCGTGLNFPLLQKAVGNEGRIVGVDLTDAMLKRANQRIEKAGWSNVVVLQANAVEFQFPQEVNGILSTFALSMMPNFAKIIENGAKSLSPGKRFGVLDLKIPENQLAKLWPLFVLITRPFGVTNDYVKQQSWKMIRLAFSQNLKNIHQIELFGGLSYIIIGEAD